MLLLVCAGQLGVATPALAQPSSPNVAAGVASILQGGKTTTIEQATQKAIINWGSFNSRAGDLIRFVQPSKDAAVLNRVVGGDASALLGDLQANGRVFVINPQGILIGKDAKIDTSAFVATTLNVSDAAFLAGNDLQLSGNSEAGIVNLGVIRASAGDVLLVARSVNNSGEIHAPQGLAALAGGTEVLYLAQGQDRIFVRSAAAGAQAAVGVDNQGVVQAAQAELKAAGGHAYALAVNHSGIVNATGTMDRAGRIVLTADGGDLRVSGALRAKNADGSGAEVLVGGDYRGGNVSNVPHAASTTVTADARIGVDGEAGKPGGKAVLWSDGLTRFDGQISATGASGGDAEVSGRTLAISGSTDLRGTQGRAGTLLLDPVSITIDNSNAPDNGSNSTVGAGWLSTQLATANVTLAATPDPLGSSITSTANSAINWSTPNQLTLNAQKIVLNGAINGTNAGSKLQLSAGLEGSTINGAVKSASVQIDGPSVFGASGGTITADSSVQLNVSERVAWSDVVVKAPSVAISANTAGQLGWLDLNAAGNRFSNLSVSMPGSVQTFEMPINVSTTQPLTVSGRIVSKQNVNVTAQGDLTLGAGTVIAATGAAAVNTLVAQGGQFVNNAGNGAMAGSSRNRVYSQSAGTFEPHRVSRRPVGLSQTGIV